MKKNNAREYFQEGYLCAESILLAGAETLGIKNPAIPAMATAFCSGTSRTTGTCGAYQGSLLLISLLHGRQHPEQDLDYCYALAQEFTTWFETRFGSTNCYKLCGCDFREDRDRIKFQKDGIKENICYPLVEDAAEFAINLLRNNI
ncbi:C-GCAxxG-C-C family protein [Maridesulfovibrio sp.]|uniref:C-GCAxxG-C-C family protein n=1 Tax=Maridesulfovibrio sp. TaxID=2795000 RepID=UPI002A187BEE|nr:C-GCAxxG-C-C family protein [Maridesulfovibrio sp.]